MPPDRSGDPFLVLVTDAFGGHGGIAKFNRDLLSSVGRFDDGAPVIALPRVAQLDVSGVPNGMLFDTTGLGGKRRYLQAVSLRVARTPRVRMIVCGHINLLSLALIANLRYRVPIALIVHGIEAWQQPSNPLAAGMLRQVSCVLAVSETTKARLLSWSHLPEERVRVLPNSVDLSAFSPGPKSPELVERYRLAGKKVILTLGRLESKERYKGFDEVLNVMPQLLRADPSIVYVVAGDGNDRARLEAKAASLGISDAVRFTGRVPESEKVPLYRCADVYAMPSRGEGFGIVFLEALACGVPCVGSSADGGREALLDGKLGALVDPDDLNAVAQAILAALARPNAGVPEGLETYSLENFEKRTHAAIRALLERS